MQRIEFLIVIRQKETPSFFLLKLKGLQVCIDHVLWHQAKIELAAVLSPPDAIVDIRRTSSKRLKPLSLLDLRGRTERGFKNAALRT